MNFYISDAENNSLMSSFMLYNILYFQDLSYDLYVAMSTVSLRDKYMKYYISCVLWNYDYYQFQFQHFHIFSFTDWMFFGEMKTDSCLSCMGID